MQARPTEKIIVFFAFPFIAFLLIIAATSKYGIGLTYDSYSYIKNAYGLSHNYGLLKFDYLFPGVWPPMYSFFIALFYKLHLNVYDAARYFNALLYGISIFYALKTLSISNFPVKNILLYAILSVFYYPIFANYLYALSEPLYITICTATLYYIIRLHHKFSNSVFILLICLSVAAILTRYVGISLFVSTALSIYSISKKYFTKRYNTAIYIFSTAAIFSAWLFRNFYLTNTLTGKGRGETGFVFYDSFISILQVLNHWFVPSIFSFNISLAILTTLIIFIIYCYRTVPEHIAKILYHLLLFIACYIIIIYFCGAFKYCNLPDDRLLSPIFIPLSIIIYASIYFKVKSLDALFAKHKSKLFAVLISIYSYSFILGIIELIASVLGGAGGYTQTEFLDKDGIKWLKNTKTDLPVYTNLREPVFLLTGKDAIRLPHIEVLNNTAQQNNILPDSGIVVLLKPGDSHIKSNRKILQQIMGRNNNKIDVSPPDIKVYNTNVTPDYFNEYEIYFSTLQRKNTGIKIQNLLSTDNTEVYIFRKENNQAY
jgi:hypothetical protein